MMCLCGNVFAPLVKFESLCLCLCGNVIAPLVKLESVFVSVWECVRSPR